MTKKLLSIFLILSILCQLPVFLSTDVKAYQRDVSVQSELKLLNALGIMDDIYEDITLGEKISRLDFAIALGRIFGVTVSSNEAEPKSYYADMQSVGTEANKAVNYLSDLKIISGSGNGNFNPYDDITYEQAVKMLVVSLGYEIAAIEKGGYPLGYFATGASLGICDGIYLDSSAPLTRECFITLIYNVLFTDLMENVSYGNEMNYEVVEGDTLLNSIMKIKYIPDALITANAFTSLDGGNGTGEGFAEINKLIFADPDMQAHNYIGKRADVFYKEEGSRHILVHISADYEILNISIDDITDISSHRISYCDTKDGKEKYASVSADAVMLFNGQALYWTPSMINLSTDGVITLERSGHSSYSVVTVESCTNMIVAAVDYMKSLVYDKLNAAAPPLDLSSYEANKRLTVYKDGEKTDINGITPDSLLSIYKSPDNSFITIKITNNKISGQLTSCSVDTVVIDGNEYPYVSSLKSDFSQRLGTYCTAYLSELGKIIWFTDNSDGSLLYGYLIDAAEETGMNKAFYLRILTQDNKTEDFKIAEKIKLNSSTPSDPITEVKNELSDISGYKQQLIQYSLNNDNEIKILNTCTATGLSSDRYRYGSLCEYMPKGDYYFRSTRSTFSGRASIDASTKVFVVSPDGSKDEDDFIVNTSSFFTDGKQYKVAAYNSDNGGKASVVVCWQELNSFSSVSIGGRVMMVDYITTAANKDGETVQKIYGLSAGKYVSYITNGETELKTSTSPSRPLKRGDIVNLAFSSKSEICYVKTLVDIDKQETTNYYYSQDNAWKDNWAISGAFYSMEGNNAIISKSGPANINAVFENPNFDNLYSVNLSASIMVYDESTDTIYTGTTGDILTYKTSGNDASRFFMRFYKDNLNTIFIFKR